MKWLVGSSLIVAAIGFYFGNRPGVQEESGENLQSRRQAVGVDPAPAPAANLASLSATDLVRAAKGRIEMTEQMRAALRFEDWAERDPEGAARAVLEFEPMLRYAKTENPEAWIDLLSDEEARRKGIRALLERHDNREAAAAVKTYAKYAAEFDAGKVDPHLSYILKNTRSAWKGGALPTSDEAKAYRRDLQELLAESIPKSKVPVAQKLELIDALAESETRTAALRSTLVNWLKKEPEAASTWVRDLPPGAYRDTAITALVQTIAPGDPDAALRWAESMHEPGLRERYTRVALRHWSLTDPASAPGAINAADLNTAAKQSLLERIKATDL